MRAVAAPARPARRAGRAVFVLAALVLASLGGSVVAAALPTTASETSVGVSRASGDGSGGLSAPFGSFAPVAGRPADPPLGVPFESLNLSGGTPIKIDGRDVPGVIPDGQNFSIAVIDRRTRAVVESGTVNHIATSQLGAIADKYVGQNNYLMVISSARGILGDAGNTNAYVDAVRKLGGRDLTPADLTLLKNGAKFSVVGVPGGAAGGAYINIDPGPGGGPHGNVFGYLRLNVATDLYAVVNPESPTFDTTNTSSAPNTATVVFNHQTYTGRLNNGMSGFMILAFDDGLNKVFDSDMLTNAYGVDSYYQSFANNILTRAIGSGSRNTIVVRSIGHPTPVGAGWNDIATTIEKLGGNRLAFNNLGADSDYSLVGSAVAGVPAIEASAVLGNNGPISGSLARNRDMVFTPVAGGSNSGVNTELIDIATQAPQSFPAFTVGATDTTTAGTAAADAYLGRKLGVCADAASQPTCSVRTAFYLDYGADWHQVATDLESTRFATYPSDAQRFTDADYRAVRAQLSVEVGMVNRVRTYFTGLQKPFGEAAQAGTIDIDRLTTAVVDSIQAPKGSSTTSYAFALLGKIASLGGFAGPPVSAVASGLSAAFALGAFLAQPSGPPQLAATISTRAADLGATVRAQMLATSRSVNGTAMLVVSDYGRLTAVNAKLPTNRWRLPNDTGPTLATMTLAVQQSAAEKLVPLAFPSLLRGTPDRPRSP